MTGTLYVPMRHLQDNGGYEHLHENDNTMWEIKSILYRLSVEEMPNCDSDFLIKVRESIVQCPSPFFFTVSIQLSKKTGLIYQLETRDSMVPKTARFSWTKEANASKIQEELLLNQICLLPVGKNRPLIQSSLIIFSHSLLLFRVIFQAGLKILFMVCCYQ